MKNYLGVLIRITLILLSLITVSLFNIHSDVTMRYRSELNDNVFAIQQETEFCNVLIIAITNNLNLQISSNCKEKVINPNVVKLWTPTIFLLRVNQFYGVHNAIPVISLHEGFLILFLWNFDLVVKKLKRKKNEKYC